MARPSRRAAYFVLMGTCIALILLAWWVVRLYSVPAALIMSAVAAVIPPTAAIVANWGALGEEDPDVRHGSEGSDGSGGSSERRR